MPRPPPALDVEDILVRMRQMLKKRGAVGIRGLTRNFQICDTDKSEKLNLVELTKCVNLCKLDLSQEEVRALHRHFDSSGDGLVSFDEFVKTVRGRMSEPRKKLVIKCFEALDQAGDGNGELSVADLKPYFNVEHDPRFLTGEKTAHELLQEFVDGFERGQGGGDGVIGIDEWIGYYEELSAGIDDDDYFGVMLVNAWSALKARGPNGEEVPAIQYVCEGDIDVLEQILRKSIFQKSVGTNEVRALKETFKRFDQDNSGEVNFREFCRAMECFGLSVSQPGQKGSGGVPPDVLRGLFNRYNTDRSECISYLEFTSGLFQREAEARSSDPAFTTGNGANLTLPNLVRDYDAVAASAAGLAPPPRRTPDTRKSPLLRPDGKGGSLGNYPVRPDRVVRPEERAKGFFR